MSNDNGHEKRLLLDIVIESGKTLNCISPMFYAELKCNIENRLYNEIIKEDK